MDCCSTANLRQVFQSRIASTSRSRRMDPAAAYTSGASKNTHGSSLKRRAADPGDSTENEIEQIITKTSTLDISEKPNSLDIRGVFVNYINPLFLTAVGAFVRLHRMDISHRVVWDEAHFGKFGSYYLKREFYSDVHPPLGKLLVALSGYIAGFKGNFKFDSGSEFPDDCNYVVMRVFNCFFGILCVPLAYRTSMMMGYGQLTTWFITLQVVFEMISLTLSRFILLDSMLLFFTVLCFFCLVNLHQLRTTDSLLSKNGLKWLVLAGISIGCVCSVKWVGMFVTALVGLYTIYDLGIKTYQLTSRKFPISFKAYFAHWVARSFTLIFIPFVIYLACFKVHFMVLNHSGTGDGSISTLLQASLEGSAIKYGPRSVAFGSLVTLRSQGLSPNLLHSHHHKYPEGSGQLQVTTYGFKDNNNNFLIEFDLETSETGKFATLEKDENNTASYQVLVKNGDTVRLVHEKNGCLLHSHKIPAFIAKRHNEVSCYASLANSDPKDEWVIETQYHEVSPSPLFQNEAVDEVHPISTNFRLRHKVLGCYLATTGQSYPAWGFQQGEVICKNTFFKNDKNTWWNIEDHVNPALPNSTTNYIPPKPRFWKEFVLLNYGMMASNNALVPDKNKFDKLSSEWWEWPILRIGLRMCGWSSTVVKYFLIGNPAVVWFSTFNLVVICIYFFITLWRWQRQTLVFKTVFDPQFDQLIVQGILPFLGWSLHYLPFALMGRVTYIHHYVPALYFGIFVSGFIIDRFVYRACNKSIRYIIYGVAYVATIGTFWYLRDLSWGMVGPSSSFSHLKILQSWMI